MSYDIAASFSINVDQMEMSGRFASSNVYPRTYGKGSWKAPESHYADYESVKRGILTHHDAFRISILRDLVGGSIQLASSTSVKYRYALEKLSQQFTTDNYFKFWEDSSLTSSNKQFEYAEGKRVEVVLDDDAYTQTLLSLKKYADYYFGILASSPEKGDFVIALDSGGFLVKMNQNTYRYTRVRQYAKIFRNRWEAELVCTKLKGTVQKLEGEVMS